MTVSGHYLWIVDSGTDRVYPFDNAAGRTPGSQSPSTSFVLAAGNTNPQVIADPPVPMRHVSRTTTFVGTSHSWPTCLPATDGRSRI